MPAMLSVYRGIRFTERQRQVVKLIAAGCSNVEIAERLGVSPRTAKAHSDVLRTKLGVSRRRQIPAAFREATGEDPLESLEAALGVRDDSRTPD
jgi:ATP/maltotriose-dependent transcriptional regulator MalT